MTPTHINTLELLSLQIQLLLSIGGSFNARNVLHSFMQTATKSLKLRSIHLYTFEDTSVENTSLTHCLSTPDRNLENQNKTVINALLLRFKNNGTLAHASVMLDDREIIAYAFDTMGVLLLEKNQGTFQESIKDVLTPVMHKLAEFYRLCLQQQRLGTEAKISKAAQHTYELQAKHDPLTNLPNRREFRYSLSKEISKSQRYNYYGALMYIDLDNFKNVNDSLGHSIGDILLTQVAQRLSAQARQGDNVFRIGGDEFVYILSNIGVTEAEAIITSTTVANRVIETLVKPIEIGEYSLHTTPSIGIAIFPDALNDDNDSESVLKHADTAMYRAKKNGRNCYEFFNPEMHIEANKRLVIEDHLRKALTNDELTLAYQPIVNTESKIVGAESLVRWHNSMFGEITPDEFICIAEDSNLILELSKWITEHVCVFAETLYRQLPSNSEFSYISINVSPRQFIQNDFVSTISAMIDSCDVPNSFIKLEFTENVLLDNLGATIEKMEKLRDNHIDFLLDDFGTGYSSLSNLHKLPIWLLKIDKSFITDFFSNNNDTQAIVNAILVMAEQLGIKCIIEGVERQEQVEYFIEKGVHGMQGYYFHKPMAGEALRALLLDDQKDAINQSQ